MSILVRGRGLSGPQFMLLSAFAFAIMGALVKVAGAAGVPLLQIIFVRAVISLLLSLADTWRLGLHPLGTHRWLLLTRGVVGFLSLSCVYYAMLHLPYAEATVLQYLHPIFTAILALVFLGEVPAKRTMICVLLSIAGLGVLLSPALSSSGFSVLPLSAIVAGVAGAFGSGVAYTVVRKLAGQEHPSVIVVYFPLVCLPATLLLGGADFIWPDGLTLFTLLGIGVFTQVGQVALTRAMAVDTASRATSLSYVQIIFAAILGVIFFDEIPVFTTYVAAALILSGALINTLWGRHQRTACAADQSSG